MTQGKHKVSGEMAYGEEEKKELVAPCVVEWSHEKGADSIEMSINCDYVDSTSTLSNERENQCSRSNMIISSGRTTSNFNVYITTCAGT